MNCLYGGWISLSQKHQLPKCDDLTPTRIKTTAAQRLGKMKQPSTTRLDEACGTMQHEGPENSLHGTNHEVWELQQAVPLIITRLRGIITTIKGVNYPG